MDGIEIEGIGGIVTFGTTIAGMGGNVTWGTVTAGTAGMGGTVSWGTVTAGTAGMGGTVSWGMVTAGTVGIVGTVGTGGFGKGMPGTAAGDAVGAAASVVSARRRPAWVMLPLKRASAMAMAKKLQVPAAAILGSFVLSDF